MSIETIVVLVLLAFVAYAWYTERQKRIQGDIANEVLKRRVTLDDKDKKLAEQLPDYQDALDELRATPIPDFMLQYVGEARAGATAPVGRDPRHGRLVDAAGGIISEEPGPQVDLGPEPQRFFDLGGPGKAPPTE